MATGSEPREVEDPEMVKIDVKVTRRQKAVIDRTWRARGYPSRSEFVRDALRDATEPLLTENALREIASGIEDVREGRTVSLDELAGDHVPDDAEPS